jgi:hypothetical protein
VEGSVFQVKGRVGTDGVKKNEEMLRRGGEGKSPVGHKLLALAVKGMDGISCLMRAAVTLADRRQGPRHQQAPFLDAKRHRRSQGPSAAGRP